MYRLHVLLRSVLYPCMWYRSLWYFWLRINAVLEAVQFLVFAIITRYHDDSLSFLMTWIDHLEPFINFHLPVDRTFTFLILFPTLTQWMPGDSFFPFLWVFDFLVSLCFIRCFRPYFLSSFILQSLHISFLKILA